MSKQSLPDTLQQVGESKDYIPFKQIIMRYGIPVNFFHG